MLVVMERGTTPEPIDIVSTEISRIGLVPHALAGAEPTSHLPIITEASHGTGGREKVLPMSRAAVAAGSDGLIVEVHHEPEKALSDGAESIYPEQFEVLMKEIAGIAKVIGRTV